MTDETTPAPIAAPSTPQLLAALAASLLPFAGPAGIAAAAVVPAAEQLLEGLMNHQSDNFTVADLEAIVAGGNADLAKLKTDVDALPS